MAFRELDYLPAPAAAKRFVCLTVCLSRSPGFISFEYCESYSCGRRKRSFCRVEQHCRLRGKREDLLVVIWFNSCPRDSWSWIRWRANWGCRLNSILKTFTLTTVIPNKLFNRNSFSTQNNIEESMYIRGTRVWIKKIVGATQQCLFKKKIYYWEDVTCVLFWFEYRF